MRSRDLFGPGNYRVITALPPRQPGTRHNKSDRGDAMWFDKIPLGVLIAFGALLTLNAAAVRMGFF
jgi:hypothetical protein